MHNNFEINLEMSESSKGNGDNEIKDTEESSQNKNIEINNIDSFKGKNIKQKLIQLKKDDEKKKKEDNDEQKEDSEEKEGEDNEGKKKAKEEQKEEGEKLKEEEEEQNEIFEKEKTNEEKISLFSQNTKIVKAFIDEDFSSLDNLDANIVIFALNDEIFGEKLIYEKEELNLLGGLRDDMKILKEKIEKIDVLEAILREVAKKVGVNPDNINDKKK